MEVQLSADGFGYCIAFVAESGTPFVSGLEGEAISALLGRQGDLKRRLAALHDAAKTEELSRQSA